MTSRAEPDALRRVTGGAPQSIGDLHQEPPDVTNYCLFPTYLVMKLVLFLKSWVGCKLVAAMVFVDRKESAGAVEAILQINAERRALLGRLRDALLAGENDEALQIARRYCGLEGPIDGHANSGIDQGQYSRTSS